VTQIRVPLSQIESAKDSGHYHGLRPSSEATMILVAYRYGLRASEVCDLQWQQIELSEGPLGLHSSTA